MLTVLAGAKYTSIISSEQLYGCLLYSIHLHSYLHRLYGCSLYPIPLRQHD